MHSNYKFSVVDVTQDGAVLWKITNVKRQCNWSGSITFDNVTDQGIVQMSIKRDNANASIPRKAITCLIHNIRKLITKSINACYIDQKLENDKY